MPQRLIIGSSVAVIAFGMVAAAWLVGGLPLPAVRYLLFAAAQFDPRLAACPVIVLGDY